MKKEKKKEAAPKPSRTKNILRKRTGRKYTSFERAFNRELARGNALGLCSLKTAIQSKSQMRVAGHATANTEKVDKKRIKEQIDSMFPPDTPPEFKNLTAHYTKK